MKGAHLPVLKISVKSKYRIFSNKCRIGNKHCHYNQIKKAPPSKNHLPLIIVAPHTMLDKNLNIIEL